MKNPSFYWIRLSQWRKTPIVFLMNADLVSMTALSRPKTHRPPFVASATRQPSFVPAVAKRAKKVKLLNAAIIAVLLVALLLNSVQTSVTPSVSRVLAEVSKHTPVSDAHAAAPAATIEENSDDKIMRFEDSSGSAIIGQIAKMPVKTAGAGEISTVSSNSKTAAKELLSILGRY